MSRIHDLDSLEILDSRGRPTVQATCTLASGAMATVSIPSGASTGAAEALELRDGDSRRYQGLGCTKAVENVRTILRTALRNSDFPEQADLDTALLNCDGTPNKATLGANALLAVSLAFARAQAVERRVPLYQHLAGMVGPQARLQLPQLTINLFSGGKHAGGQVAIQDVLVVPSTTSINEGLAQTYAVYQAAAELCRKKYEARPLVADEGGLAPPFSRTADMLADAVAAIEAATLRPGVDMQIAVDVASSHFYRAGQYDIDGRQLTSGQMIAMLSEWCRQWPIISIEDGLAEDDWAHWPQLRQALPDNVLVLGDDLLCTNPARIRRAVQVHAANALLLKVNQIGTLTEAAQSCQLARSAGWKVTVSARSGETEDDWLADLAVAWGDQIKVGSITRSERLAKYNRLLAIERDLQGGRDEVRNMGTNQ